LTEKRNAAHKLEKSVNCDTGNRGSIPTESDHKFHSFCLSGLFRFVRAFTQQSALSEIYRGFDGFTLTVHNNIQAFTESKWKEVMPTKKGVGFVPVN
jgi:hypothetical protein